MVDEKEGEFKCPQCKKNNGIFCKFRDIQNGDFKYWKCRKEYTNNNTKLENKWAFYHGKTERKWYCCCICGDNRCGECLRNALTFKIMPTCPEDNILKILYGFFLIGFYFYAFIIYIIIFWWMDLINWCISRNYKLVGKLEDERNLIMIDLIDEVKDKKIWDYAYSEERWNSNKSWLCKKCKYESQTFSKFIQNNNDDLNQTTTVINQPEPSTAISPPTLTFSVLFNSTDNNILYSVSCSKTDLFSEVEEKLYDEYPEYRHKNCYFLQKGKTINKNMTIEENHLI